MSCGCTAKMVVTSFESNPRVVNIVYTWKHTGHVPGSEHDLITAPVTRNTKTLISQLVEQHLTWTSIKHLLRVDKEVLTSILDGESTTIPTILRVNYQTVYYAIKSSMERRGQLKLDMKDSLLEWNSKIVNSDGYFEKNNLGAQQVGALWVAFMSKWQLKVTYEIILLL
jgi:hypothetical protein